MSRIVVIEDHVDTADLLREFLEGLGHHVATAHSGSAGIELAFSFAADVVVCDVGLPDMEGYAVARTLRADARTARLRLIVMTGYTTDEDRQRAREAGFDLHVSKPVDPFALERLLTG